MPRTRGRQAPRADGSAAPREMELSPGLDAPRERELLRGLNAPQREAVTHGEGPALVLAGPGSGKTTVIVRRILYLIQERRVPPEEILVVTFTKDAALSMRQRFLERADKVHPVNFGTFHSIFYHILLQSGDLKNGSTFLNPSQKKSILLNLLKEKAMEREGRYDYDALKNDAESFPDAIGYYKNTRDMEAARGRVAVSWRERFPEVFEEYQRRCMIRGGMDFDDMAYECERLLARDETRRRYWQNRFRHILIDEFQDVNPVQYEVVKLLGERHGNLFAVGDDDQAIYGFRGSNPACLQRFAEEFRAERIILNANYRSTAKIVDAAERVISENQNRFVKRCRAAGDGGSGENAGIESKNDVIIKNFETTNQELAYLKQELQDFIQKDPKRTCGVLFRTNGNMQILAAVLAKANVPFQMKEQTKSPYEHFIAKDVMAYLKLAAGDRRRAIFLSVMNRPLRYLSRDCLGDADWVDFRRLIEWHVRRNRPGDGKIAQSLHKLEGQLRTMGAMSPATAILYLSKSVGYEEYLRGQSGAKEHLEEWLELLEFLREDARGYESLEQLEKAWMKSAAPSRDGEGAIRLMTVHASKGLEFDRVYMPDCNEKVYPHGTMPDRETVEEERRIFYVGMTRAKKHLELLCTSGTRERPRLMSRFLNPLLDHSSINSSNSQLSKYSSNASTTFSYSSSSSM